jgi:hypothetical protein
MPRPAPRVAPATKLLGQRVVSFLATGRVRDLAASGDCLRRPAIAIPQMQIRAETNRKNGRLNLCISLFLMRQSELNPIGSETDRHVISSDEKQQAG